MIGLPSFPLKFFFINLKDKTSGYCQTAQKGERSLHSADFAKSRSVLIPRELIEPRQQSASEGMKLYVARRPICSVTNKRSQDFLVMSHESRVMLLESRDYG